MGDGSTVAGIIGQLPSLEVPYWMHLRTEWQEPPPVYYVFIRKAKYHFRTTLNLINVLDNHKSVNHVPKYAELRVGDNKLFVAYYFQSGAPLRLPNFPPDN